MNACRTICLTVVICWALLMANIWYALKHHQSTTVERTTRVWVKAQDCGGEK